MKTPEDVKLEKSMSLKTCSYLAYDMSINFTAAKGMKVFSMDVDSEFPERFIINFAGDLIKMENVK